MPDARGSAATGLRASLPDACAAAFPKPSANAQSRADSAGRRPPRDVIERYKIMV